MAFFPSEHWYIKRAVDLFDWGSALIDLNVNEQESVFNDTITNVMLNFIPNKIIDCNYSGPSLDEPPYKISYSL